MSPREIFQKALLIGAVSIILTHNHPSGDPAPSAEDIATTKNLKKAGEIVGVLIADHIVVGREGYVSFVENGIR